MENPDESFSFLGEREDRGLRIQRKTRKRLDQLMSEMCRIDPMTEGALRRTVMETYGLSSGDARFLVDLAREADAVAVDRDRQALKEAFTYRDHQHDLWQVLLRDMDRPFFAPLRIAGIPRIAAEPFVEECYYEKGALEPLARRYHGSGKWHEEEFDPLLRRLEEAQLFDAMERLCTSVARGSRSRFFAERAGRNGYASEAWLEKFREYALRAHDEAIGWMRRIGRDEAAERLAEQREEVREGRVPELPPISDFRRMDEPVFWELISRSRAQAVTPEDQIGALETLLPTFKAADIRRFGSLYAGHMRKLHHWDVWALAYLARDGCSDDSFMAFRTWLILQGDPALLELAVADPARAARRVPRNPELPDGTLLPLIEEAFLRRKGAPVELPMIDRPRPRGSEWPEDEVEALYPEIARHYASVEACLQPAMPL